MKNIISKLKFQIYITLVFIAMVLIFNVVFAPLMPIILNYPEGTVGGNFQYELENTNYYIQFLFIDLELLGVFLIILFSMSSFIIEIDEKLKNEDEKQIAKIFSKLYSLPYKIYIVYIFVASALVVIGHALTVRMVGVTTVKLFIFFFSFITVTGTILLLVIKNYIIRILKDKKYIRNIDYKKMSLSKKMIYQLLPLFVVAVLFTSLVGYNKVIAEKSDMIFLIYKQRLENIFENEQYNSIEEVYSRLKEVEKVAKDDRFFIKNDKGVFYDEKGNKTEYSKFFEKYLNELSDSNQGRVYEYYGVDAQATTVKVHVNSMEYVVGAYYTMDSYEVFKYFLILFILLFLLDVFILRYVSVNLSKDISKITESLNEIVNEDQSSRNRKLVVLSNDEIGELIKAFNKIQDMTKDHIKQIHDNQETLMESDRLASLGQLIGGIAHNLKTPIMSISGNLQGLQDLILEYETSIGDPEVNDNDHKEIAGEMQELVKKSKIHLSYMSDIITVVKGQAVQGEDLQSFSPVEVMERIDILMKHDLKKALIELRVNIEEKAEGIYLKGNINGLVQVIDNCIQNAIHAYNGQINQYIDVNISTDNSNVCFAITDYGCGIPEEVQKKLFKEMITTKGKNGTGLGLYMSHSLIKGKFKGEFKFESEVGKGTTFYIIIPISE